jgi:hypothetical protein
VAKRSRKRTSQDNPASIMDAALVISGIMNWVNDEGQRRPAQEQMLAGALQTVLESWSKRPVAIRADQDFVGAILDSDMDGPVTAGWLTQTPFDYMAVSLAEPLVVHDGTAFCNYYGYLATGFRQTTLIDPGPDGQPGSARTYYTPLGSGTGIRCFWVFTAEGDPAPRIQTVSAIVNDESRAQRSVQELIDSQQSMQEILGATWGKELDVLVPLSLLLPMYLTSQEPDLQELAPEQTRRPQQLAAASIYNLGWRVGSSIRAWRKEATFKGTSEATSRSDERRSGWRLPPHIRRAHWTRVRVATRAEDGAIVGDRSGAMGVDWHYESRWIPPTPVNADVGPISPVVRDVEL